MFKFIKSMSLLLGLVVTGIPNFAPVTEAAAQQKAPPDLSSNTVAWIAVNRDFVGALSGPQPVANDPAHPSAITGTRYRVADLANPNLTPWAKERMKEANNVLLAGGLASTAFSRCKPPGVTGFLLSVGDPIYFVQTAREVLMINAGNQEVRHIYLDVPHSVGPKPSWYGESVGRDKGDTLVIDTVGLNDRTMIDNFRTPHSEQLHVVERWKLTDGGKTLEVYVQIDDPQAFYEPWRAIQGIDAWKRLILRRSARRTIPTSIYHIPNSNRPYF
jgi:hypothetical protein